MSNRTMSGLSQAQAMCIGAQKSSSWWLTLTPRSMRTSAMKTLSYRAHWKKYRKETQAMINKSANITDSQSVTGEAQTVFSIPSETKGKGEMSDWWGNLAIDNGDEKASRGRYFKSQSVSWLDSWIIYSEFSKIFICIHYASDSKNSLLGLLTDI